MPDTAMPNADSGPWALLQRGFADVRNLTRRSKITKKLSGINILVFRFVLSVCLSSFIVQFVDMHFALIFLFSFFVSSVLLFAYIPILEYIMGHARHLIEGLRASIIIMFFNLTVAVAGLLFNSILLASVALAVVFLQLGILAVTNFRILTKPKIDQTLEPPEVWKYVGRMTIGSGVLSLVIDLALVLYRVLVA